MTHKILVVLSILWAAALPIHMLRVVIKYGGGTPEMIGYSIGAMLLFFPWLIVLIPLVMGAIYTKPKQN